MDDLKQEHIQLVLDTIQKEIEKHNTEKEIIENGINQTYDAKIKEEGTRDIKSIEQTIENYENEKSTFLGLVHEEEENKKIISQVNETLEKMEKSRQNLLKEQEECQFEIEKINGKFIFDDNGKLVKTKELKEYEADLGKITNELALLDIKKAEYDKELKHLADRNETISNLINETLDKYHIQLIKLEENEKENELPNGTGNEEKENEPPAGTGMKGKKNQSSLLGAQRSAPIKTNLQNQGKGKENQSSPLGAQRSASIETNLQNQGRRKGQIPPIPPTHLTPPNPPKSEKEITKIIVNPLKNTIDYYFNYNKNKLKGWRDKYASELSYDNSKIQSVIFILDFIEKKGDLSDISEMIDPNIVALIESRSKEFNIQIDDYLNMLRGQESNFNIEYDLRDIYNSDLDYKQIKNINKIAKLANIKTNGAISYKKDNILKRAFGNIKKRIEYFDRKMIDSAENQEEIEEVNNNSKDSRLSKLKDKTKEKLNDAKDFASTKVDDAKHFTSRKLSTVKRLGRETLETLNIAGTRISGYFKGENPLVTDMKVNNIREKSFVPKAKVDEKAAVEKVDGAQNDEVIIENPDGTKTTGKRIWSIDEEVK